MNTDSAEFNGSDYLKENTFRTIDEETHGRDQAIQLDLPPLSVVYFKKSSLLEQFISANNEAGGFILSFDKLSIADFSKKPCIFLQAVFAYIFTKPALVSSEKIDKSNFIPNC